MSTDLATVQDDSNLVPVLASLSDEMFSKLAAAKFLPRIKLLGGSSRLVKSGKFPMGHFGLVVGKDQVEDLGDQFDCLVLNVRPKAMDLNIEPVLSVFDPAHEEFQRIREESKGADSGCMWGPEFLIWLPTKKRFATMFFGNPTMRREAPVLFQRRGKGATIKSQLIETKQYSWHGPVCTDCSTPFALPDPDESVSQQNDFLNPKVEVLDKAEATMERDR